MKFHFEILSQKQKEILSFIEKFNDNFVLVWWTAIALHLWHRESVDFDLFLPNCELLPLRNIKSKIKNSKLDYKILVETDFHFEISINWVKITFFAYLYEIPQKQIIREKYFKTCSLEFLAIMKADAIWKRAKRKDYVDMYFLINKFWLKNIWNNAKSFFWPDFNEKIFYSQLSYFDDMDYSEEVIYTKWNEKTKDEIRTYLINESKTIIKKAN